jgi:ribonuclease P protein component
VRTLALEFLNGPSASRKDLMKRKYRLRRNSDFQRVRHVGKSYASPLLVLAFLRNNLAHSRFGFVVSKKLGKAVRRNKIKRRIREATRLRLRHISSGYDLVFIARKQAAQASYWELAAAVEQLTKRANLWHDVPELGDTPDLETAHKIETGVSSGVESEI